MYVTTDTLPRAVSVQPSATIDFRGDKSIGGHGTVWTVEQTRSSPPIDSLARLGGVTAANPENALATIRVPSCRCGVHVRQDCLGANLAATDRCVAPTRRFRVGL